MQLAHLPSPRMQKSTQLVIPAKVRIQHFTYNQFRTPAFAGVIKSVL